MTPPKRNQTETVTVYEYLLRLCDQFAMLHNVCDHPYKIQLLLNDYFEHLRRLTNYVASSPGEYIPVWKVDILLQHIRQAMDTYEPLLNMYFTKAEYSDDNDDDQMGINEIEEKVKQPKPNTDRMTGACNMAAKGDANGTNKKDKTKSTATRTTPDLYPPWHQFIQSHDHLYIAISSRTTDVMGQDRQMTMTDDNTVELFVTVPDSMRQCLAVPSQTGTIFPFDRSAVKRMPAISAPDKELRNRCAHCLEPVKNKLKCAACRCVCYCDRMCQRAHWQRHSADCRKKK